MPAPTRHCSKLAWAAALVASGCLSTPDPSVVDGGGDQADSSVADASTAVFDDAFIDAFIGPDAGAIATRVDKLAAGRDHTCALFDNGRIKCWGEGSSGRLGYADLFGYDGADQPNDVGDDEPLDSVPFVDVGGVAIDITAGLFHTCALLMGGAVRCWGANTVGQIGYPANWSLNPELQRIGDDEHPSTVGDVLVGASVQQVAAGGLQTCVIVDDDTARCWGEHQFGTLGYPGQSEPIGDDEQPSVAPAIDLGDTVSQLAVGNEHVCARLTDGTLRCWGRGRHGRLGYSDTLGNEMNGEPEWIGDDETPASAGAVTVGDTAVDIAVGLNHTCAILTTDHAVRCWGSSQGPALGQFTEDIGDDELPTASPLVSLGGAANQLALGDSYSCALLSDKTVRCWGAADGGRLGYGDELPIGDNETPAQRGAVPVGGDVQQIVTGYEHTCVLLTSGTVRCWGNGASGRLGYGDIENVGDNETPTQKGDIALLP